jgi:hypothetical protein
VKIATAPFWMKKKSPTVAKICVKTSPRCTRRMRRR